MPRATWRMPDLHTLPSWQNVSRVGIDIETRDPDLRTLGPGVRRGGLIVGISFALVDGPAHYLPIAHAEGPNLPREHVLHYVRDQAARYEGVIVGAGLRYDLDYLEQAGVTFPRARLRDVQIADPLICELHRSYALDDIAARWGIEGKDDRILGEAAAAYGIDPRRDLWRLPAAYVGQYAERDAAMLLPILARQEREIAAVDGLQQIYDLESDVLPCLVAMTRRGVRVDLDALGRIEAWATHEEREACARAGIDAAHLWRAGVIAPRLTAIGTKVPTTDAGSASITAELLETVAHPIAESILRARQFSKLRSTFCASIRDHVIGDRLHPSYHQIAGEGGGPRFGRMSSSHPNIQQQPTRHEEYGALWRSIYIPEDGERWVCVDYSQQEPRIMVHFAETAGLRGAEAVARRYRDDPATDHHQVMADLTGLPRAQAKTIFLGLCYGMGRATLCRSLGLPEWQGERILARFHAAAPFVRELARGAQTHAHRAGTIRTLLGRRLNFPPAAVDWARRALNRLIQGSAADQTKAAMVAATRAGLPLRLVVHDEFDLSIERDSDADTLAQIMREAVTLSVPSHITTKIGPNWGGIV